MFIHRALLYFGAAVLALVTPPVDAGALSDTSYEVYFLTGHASESKALYQGRYDTAIERLELRLSKESPCREKQLVNLCAALVANRQLDKAKDVCDRAIESQGDLGDVDYNSRGVIHALNGDYVSAISDFEKAADKSNYPYPRAHFTESLEGLHQFYKDDLDRSIRVAKHNKSAAIMMQARTERNTAKDLTADVR
jgi:tetratricopeptide (TPR) repeat protein